MNNYFTDRMSEQDIQKLEYLSTIPSLLEKCQNEYFALPAVSNRQTTYRYGSFCSRIAKRRDFLYKLNLKAGANIAVLCRNDLNAMELYLAIMSAGFTVVMIPALENSSKLDFICNKFDIEALFVSTEFMSLVENLKCMTFSSECTGEKEAPCREVSKDTTAAIYFTGSINSNPKGVVLSHGALMRGALNGALSSENPWNNVYIAFIPFSNIFGSVFGFLSCIFTGSLIYASNDIALSINDIPSVKPTKLILVPSIAELILSVAKMKGEAFLGGRLTHFICGGSSVSEKLVKMCTSMNIRICAGYGLTEGANLTSGNLDMERYSGSVGFVYPEQEYRIVDGELWIKGDNVMKGYYKDPELTARVLENGWLKTGDLVKENKKGYLFITGKKKSIILLENSVNVSPESIEELFLRDKGVKECLVKGINVNGSTAIGAEIYPFMMEFRQSSDMDIQNYMNSLKEQINKKLPSQIQVGKITVRNTEFKKTPSLKIDRAGN